MTRRRVAAALAIVAIAGLVVGCGKRGAPQPPEPRGPLPAERVEVSQVGPDVVVRYTVPKRRGAARSQEIVLAELVRVSFPPGTTPDEGADTFRRRGRPVTLLGSREPDATALAPGQRLELRDPRSSAAWAELEGHAVRYGVVLLDRRGRRSPLVATSVLVPEDVPDAPTGLDARAVADGVRLTWNPADGELVYRVYRAEADGPFDELARNAEPVEGAEYVDSVVVLGTRYRYVVRAARDDAMPVRESADSNVAEALAVDRFAPAVPEGLVAVQEGAFVRLFWNPAAERDLAGYRVDRVVGDGDWAPAHDGLLTDPLYLDRAVAVGQRIRYRVTALDSADPPNASPPSSEAVVVVAADPTTGGGAR